VAPPVFPPTREERASQWACAPGGGHGGLTRVEVAAGEIGALHIGEPVRAPVLLPESAARRQVTN